MKEISLFLSQLPNIFAFTLNSPKLKANMVIHKNTDVIVYSYNNIDSLHDTLAYFLLDMSFQTRKNTDFLYWCLVLYLHKYGYFYLEQGRKLTIAIANYINKSRYSNSGKIVSEPIINKELFNIEIPVKLTPSMTHLLFAQTFARVRGKVEIWVYEEGNLIKDSPYSSYAEVCELVGLSRTSRLVRRYIDTGKLYKNKYSFYSSRK